MPAEPVSPSRTEDATRATPASRFPVADFQRCMETGDVDGALELFADDCEARPLGSDRVSFQGKDRVRVLLKALLDTGRLKYKEALRSDETVVLLFDISFSDQTFEAIDVLKIDEDGRCTEISAMARPYKPMTLHTGRMLLSYARQGGGLLHRLVAALLVWPVEGAQRAGEPVGVWLVRGGMRRGIERG